MLGIDDDDGSIVVKDGSLYIPPTPVMFVW